MRGYTRNMLNVICQCGNTAIEQVFTTFKFWYCEECKKEVDPKKRPYDLEKRSYDPSEIELPVLEDPSIWDKANVTVTTSGCTVKAARSLQGQVMKIARGEG